MDHVLGLKCTICGAEYAAGEVDYVCPKHGDDGILDVVYDYRHVAQRISPEKLAGSPTRSIWRYLPLLPVSPRLSSSWCGARCWAAWAGRRSTPRRAWRRDLGLRHLWVKDDGRQPTASFKDRASAIAVVKTRELGYEVVTTASTGNAAAALSGLCAAVVPAQRHLCAPHRAPGQDRPTAGLWRDRAAGGRHLRRRL